MDIFVANIPLKFGMSLYRSWIKRFGGHLQMDLTYDFVLIFGGEEIRLYKEDSLAYIISGIKDPTNYLIYARRTGVGANILHRDDSTLPTENF